MRPFLTALALTGVSCGGGSDLPCLAVDCQAEDSAVLSGTPSFDRVAWGCCVPETDPSCPDNGALWLDLLLSGAADSVDLQLTQVTEGVSSYQELHSLPRVSSDPSANWSIHYLELPSQDQFEAGQSTLFLCEEDPLNQLNWTLLLSSDSAPGDDLCGTWGQALDTSEECQALIPDS